MNINVLRRAKIPNGPCPICGCMNTVHAFTAVDLNWKTQGSFPYIRCKSCEALFRPTGSIIPSGAYPWGYGSFVNPGSHVLNLRIDSKANRRRAAFIESTCAPGTILDVGCGSGFFLAFMRLRGWQVHGLETAVEHVDFARDILNLFNVTKGAWPATSGTYQNFNAISMIHLIEHMTDPISALSAVRNSLCLGGTILLETPNILSWPARIFWSRWVTLDAPRHMVLFSPKSLACCLRSAGFEDIRMITYSPSTMEWSESLRYLLNQKWQKDRGDTLPVGAVTQAIRKLERGDEMMRQRILQPVHAAERLLYRFINQFADTMRQGCNILAVAISPSKLYEKNE